MLWHGRPYGCGSWPPAFPRSVYTEQLLCFILIWLFKLTTSILQSIVSLFHNFMGLTVYKLCQFYGSYCKYIVTILWVLLYKYCDNFMGLTVHILCQFYGSYCTYIVTILWILLHIYCDNFMGLTVHILWQIYGSYYILWQLHES